MLGVQHEYGVTGGRTMPSGPVMLKNNTTFYQWNLTWATKCLNLKYKKPTLKRLLNPRLEGPNSSKEFRANPSDSLYRNILNPPESNHSCNVSVIIKYVVKNQAHWTKLLEKHNKIIGTVDTRIRRLIIINRSVIV